MSLDKKWESPGLLVTWDRVLLDIFSLGDFAKHPPH
jgi:hypothetical protein